MPARLPTCLPIQGKGWLLGRLGSARCGSRRGWERGGRPSLQPVLHLGSRLSTLTHPAQASNVLLPLDPPALNTLKQPTPVWSTSVKRWNARTTLPSLVLTTPCAAQGCRGGKWARGLPRTRGGAAHACNARTAGKYRLAGGGRDAAHINQ